MNVEIIVNKITLVFVFKIISTFIGQILRFFFMHVLKKDVLLLWP